MDNKTSSLLSKYLDQIKDIERMGDHLKNILDGIITKEYCKYDEFNH